MRQNFSSSITFIF